MRRLYGAAPFNSAIGSGRKGGAFIDSSIRKERKATSYRIEPLEDSACPECGSKLVLRDAGVSGHFWGCKSFPRCRHTQPAEVVKTR